MLIFDKIVLHLFSKKKHSKCPSNFSLNLHCRKGNVRLKRMLGGFYAQIYILVSKILKHK